MDAVTAELIRSSLSYASEEMGIALRNSAYSPNIKERMDHSAAIFDSEARLLAQAEHIPVHLGSLPWGLKNTISYCQKEGIALSDGSMVVVNNPYISGTHLNDVTVVRPVFHSGNLVAYAANKAHHSDVGGIVPGSISVSARTIFEEGFIINPVHLMRRNEFVDETISLFSSNSRTATERKGDLRAQVAANITGERRILEVIEKYGFDEIEQAADDSLDYTEKMVRLRIAALRKGEFRAEERLEQTPRRDIRLKVNVRISDRGLDLDYAGTDRQVESPLNAVFGVTLSSVYYVVRTLTGDDIPMNEGMFRPIRVKISEGTILSATFPFPVAGGNVETSQRNADLLYRAFAKANPEKVPAASGGSMNNVMIGGSQDGTNWAFYETIGVGLGGRNGMDGIDGIQSNMTNTMNTPIEEIERSFPIMMRKYEFRRNSSGAGQYRGGSGLIRSYEALSESTTITILAERERYAPWGLRGGKPGANTRCVLFSKGHRRVTIPTKCSFRLKKGDVVEIQTAGGGGYGDPQKRAGSAITVDAENGLITKRFAKKSSYPVKPSRR